MLLAGCTSLHIHCVSCLYSIPVLITCPHHYIHVRDIRINISGSKCDGHASVECTGTYSIHVFAIFLNTSRHVTVIIALCDIVIFTKYAIRIPYIVSCLFVA